MKNVYTSWNLTLLADRLIEKIIENWKMPFCSPAVVFTDPKTEQWFKLHWLKSKGAGNSILMNLKTLRIQQFLFDLVTPQAALQSGKIDILSVELLRDLLITKLTEKSDDGKYYFESLSSPEVTAYLTSQESTSKINANHLYDFAQTIASLFLDYEDTRPDSLKDVLAEKPWQQKLYNDVIGEDGVEVAGTKYLTLYQLVKQNKKNNNGSLPFNWQKERVVFIFGFSGIGQIYRNILEDFSKEYQLEVFLQLDNIKAEPVNQLLKKWGKFGKEQYTLWSKDCTAQTLDSSKAFNKTDSLLHRTQKSIAEDKEFTQEEYDAADTSITLTGAPTRLRETEALHSKICELLSKNDDTQLGDILVVAPKIQDYKTAIEQVFDQNDQYAAESDFPYIPYIIADYSGERSLTAEALTILFGILKKGYLSRSDVFALLHNYLVQTVRGISEEEVSNWADWASVLNIYRDREDHEDWQKAKNRLLLSRLTTDLVEANGYQYLPFESMTTTDSSSLYKFIQVIDELKEWESYAVKEKLDLADIDRLEELLKNWMLFDGDIPDSLFNESLVFQNVVEEIERQRLTTDQNVFADCFANALFDRSAAVTLHSSNILAKGITFANFESNRILSAKYIFFMGLDSKTFPGVDSDNELDLRGDKEHRQPGDESIPDRNKNAFVCQLMAAREGIFFSYVNKNLQKDEDIFKTSVLSDLFQTVYIPGVDEHNKPKLENTEYEKHIKIDEDRPWKELFTQREFRNKNNFIQLQKNEKPQKPSDRIKSILNNSGNQKATPPDRVTISQIKAFLKEPFVFAVNQKLTKEYDDEEKEQLEFEPLFLDRLQNSEIRKTYIPAEIENRGRLTVESIAHDLSVQNALPDSYFGKLSVESAVGISQQLLEKINEKCPFASNLVFNENKSVCINYNSTPDKKDWFISGEYAWYNKDYADTKVINTLELSNSKDILKGYITSLVLLASQPEEDKNEYTVSLYAAGIGNNNAFVSTPKSYKATPDEARGILNDIYKEMFIVQYHKCVPLSFIQTDLDNIKKGEQAINFLKFKNDLCGNPFKSNEWTYFSKKNLFDVNTDLGYSDSNFDDNWKDAKEHQIKLIKFLAEAEQPVKGE